jgi:hypothetical protein
MRMAFALSHGDDVEVPPPAPKNDQKAPARQAVTPSMCPESHPEDGDVESHTVDASALEAMWSVVNRQAQQRWVWHAMAHQKGSSGHRCAAPRRMTDADRGSHGSGPVGADDCTPIPPRVATACASGGPCSRYAAHTHDRAPAAHLTDPPQAGRAEDHRFFAINHEA